MCFLFCFHQKSISDRFCSVLFSRYLRARVSWAGFSWKLGCLLDRTLLIESTVDCEWCATSSMSTLVTHHVICHSIQSKTLINRQKYNTNEPQIQIRLAKNFHNYCYGVHLSHSPSHLLILAVFFFGKRTKETPKKIKMLGLLNFQYPPSSLAHIWAVYTHIFNTRLLVLLSFAPLSSHLCLWNQIIFYV